MHFQLFLVRGGQKRASHSFFADDELEASQLGRLLLNAASDEFDTCEIWSGSRMVGSMTAGGYFATVSLAEVARRRQEQLADMEAAIMDGFLAVARSRRLLERTATLQQLLGRDAPGQGALPATVGRLHVTLPAAVP